MKRALLLILTATLSLPAFAKDAQTVTKTGYKHVTVVTDRFSGVSTVILEERFISQLNGVHLAASESDGHINLMLHIASDQGWAALNGLQVPTLVDGKPARGTGIHPGHTKRIRKHLEQESRDGRDTDRTHQRGGTASPDHC